MRIEDVIKVLLSSNAVCVTSGNSEVFYVKVETAEVPARGKAVGADLGQDEGQGIFCISLADLLQAPRQMPVNCLLEDGSTEECELYGSTPEPYTSRGVVMELQGRLPWLVGLLAFLTVSSAILEYFDGLLQKHLVIAFYLTALVGCGGNSGSQAASLVLQGLATGELAPTTGDILKVLQKELGVSLGISAVLSVVVMLRILLFGGLVADALTIAAAMAVTVVFSVVFGAAAPLLLQRLGLDPAKVSGPLLSTVIDIFGVVFACASAQFFEAAGAFG